MTTAGPNYPATAANESFIGDVAWSNPTNVTADDASAASVALSNQFSYYLLATGFGFAIPSGATIDGVEVSYEAKCDFVDSVEYSLKLHFASVVAGTDHSDGTTYGSSYGVLTRGGAADLWGLSLTQAGVNDSDFGVALQVYSPSLATSVEVDYITIKVWYTPAADDGSPQVVTSSSFAVARQRPRWTALHRTYEHYPEVVPETPDNTPSVVRGGFRLPSPIFARSRVIGAADDFEVDSTPGWESSVIHARGLGNVLPRRRSVAVLLAAPEGQGSVCCCPFGAVVVSSRFATALVVADGSTPSASATPIEPALHPVAPNTAAVVADKFATAILIENTCTC